MNAQLRRAGLMVSGALLGIAVGPVAAFADNPIRDLNLTEGKKAPGVDAIQTLINYAGMYALLACAGGFLISLLIVVLGPRLGFEHGSRIGKAGILVSLIAAFAIGMATVLINFFFNMGLKA